MIPPNRPQVFSIPVEQARPLRNLILRPGLPPETCIYPDDDAPKTFHCGAFLDGDLVGIASIFQESPPFDTDPDAWRLRGMAVSARARRKGFGTALIEACLDHAAAFCGSILWCNARTNVLPFYKTMGFHRKGEEFNVPESGPHFVMWRNIIKK
ncbi:GNAT family N-acetyltransferase [Chloroflexota bacterium]